MSVGFIGGKFLPLHQGHVYSIIRASTMVDKLYVVLSHSEKRDRDLCERAGCKYIPAETRMSWLHKLASDHIVPISVEDSFGDDDYDWDEGARLIKQELGERVDKVFGSESSYRESFSRNYPTAEYMLIDTQREKFPISGTEIRENPLAHWDMIPEFVRPFFTKKVIVTGTESCGKSTLIKNLALLYNTTYVDEVGRKVCAEVGGPECLTPSDYRRIAFEHQLKINEKLKHANKVLFVDTEALVTSYYAGLYSGYTDNLFAEIAKHEDADLWIYLEPDVRWVGDGERRHGEKSIREANNLKLKEILDSAGVKYVTVSGTYDERLARSMDLVNALIGGGSSKT